MSVGHPPHPSETVKLEYNQLQSISEIWPIAAQRFGEIVALRDPHVKPEVNLTYVELNRQVQRFAASLQALGVKPGDRVALFADNSSRWFIADQGSIMAGAVNVVRSSQASPEELVYILENSGATYLLVEDAATLSKLQPFLTKLPLKLVALLSDEDVANNGQSQVLNFPQIFQEGTHGAVRAVPLDREHLATLIYTSGTSGKPKGVMLSHGNLLHIITAMPAAVQPEVGDRILSILPTWHSFGRLVDYYFLSQGCTQIYTSIRNLKGDLQTYKPHYMGSVPRLWESLYEGMQKKFRGEPATRQKLINTFFGISQKYILARRTQQGLDINNLNPSGLQRFLAQLQMLFLGPLHQLGDRIVYTKIRQAMGGQFKQSFSGGGSLAMHLETFFEAVGIELIVGYGLTETSPVLTSRRAEHNLRRSAGKPIPKTEIRIVDPQTRQTLPTGQQGLVIVRGPQVMQGYYQNPEATAKVIDQEGWFDTGDLGWLTPTQDLVLTGRAKDTIVLSNGENIEPQPLEDACARSSFIDQIMVVGQDQRSLGALIVPNLDALQQWASEQNASIQHPGNTPTPGSKVLTFTDQPIQDLYRQELTREVKNRPNYRPDERIGPFAFALEAFSIENGMLTQTLKVRRRVVMEHYRDMINGMFK
ncbi:AMP-dependent synthetase/ligase [Acaryochloris marina]|uniref:Long-chain-fatty-acid-CoA ligase, putative n=1 Tax=Acaryochloris marina (strain MBIC 11017) TaxID=329726 RepID=B0CE42_ACAM1|nr:AMP-binding protein [Acaryochloris marina]ABW30516.1 long-chain-fatty-acid-CoA ligase, putative [Acaryochloris marina MBIC11017]BDM79321.1 long-chain-fatty-acid--CoA ligase [Acaryochloris marina MBIC10699]